VYDPTRYYSPAKTWLKAAGQFLITFIASGAALEVALQVNTTAGGLPDSWEDFAARWPVLVGAFGAGIYRAIQNYAKHRDTPRAPDNPGGVKYGIALLLIPVLAFTAAGCATKAETRFIDADGTSFSAVSKAGPFGTLDTTNQQMTYRWDATEGGLIAVGQDAQGLDNSGQVDAIGATGEALGAALGPILSQLVAGGVLGGGGGEVESGTTLSRIERIEKLLDLLVRVRGMAVPPE
jgi:hypothetical protein